jgi:multimeric flavodoxin WrbA
MKVILINGSPHENGCTNRALTEIANTLKAQGVDAEIHWLGISAIAGCRGCGACAKLGKCIVEDRVNELAPLIRDADGVVFGSPVHYAAAGGTITAFMDRLFYSSSKALAGKPACAVFSCRRGGASAAFDQLNKYFTISSMPIVSGQYWNMVHGSKPEDVEQDLEGLQIMRSLGRNMAWLLSCIEAGKEKGICFPEKEPPIRTNFIR